jgi:holo-[acyl-carrier protein] synthase
MRFLDRVFTPQELALFGGSLPSLAARFAAKEAVSKALGCGIGKVSFQDIEILRGDLGEPLLLLHSQAKQIAEQFGWVSWSLSLSHTRENAIAFVVAVCQS